MILASLALGYFWTPYWFLLTAFVGIQLIIYGTTRFCPMAIFLKKLGAKEQ